MVGRHEAREDRRVRRKGQGDGGGLVFEDQPVLRQGVEVRRVDPLEAVTSEAVGARRVQGHDDDVQRARRRPLRPDSGTCFLVRAGRPTEDEDYDKETEEDEDRKEETCADSWSHDSAHPIGPATRTSTATRSEENETIKKSDFYAN